MRFQNETKRAMRCLRLARHHLLLWFAAACVGLAIRHHQMLHWFAVVCMVAIITWVIIDLFGPVLQLQNAATRLKARWIRLSSCASWKRWPLHAR